MHLAVTAVSVAEDNREAELAQGVGFTVSKLPYQVRAGQSLKDVATAAPAQKGSALTATGIGEANAKVEGLLRAGELLKVPAYQYKRLENDSDTFLDAFFSVRAQGVDGLGLKKEILTWYEQALAKLNEEVIWAAILPGQKVDVPTG